MTVTYIHHVPSADTPGSFLRLLVLWKGSVFKGIWKDLVMYFAVYGVLSVFYRFVMIYDEDVKLNFERVCVYMNKFENLIPLPFLLGFYVTQVMNRWWSQFMSMPWVDGICGALHVCMPGAKWSNARRRILRYSLVSMLMVFKKISDKIDKKYKNYQSFVDCGLLTEEEKKKIEKYEETTDKQYHCYWVPMRWTQRVVREVYDEGGISDVMLTKILNEIQAYTNCCGTLLCYAWVNIPLVYTQIVTISCYIYFGVSLLGRQHLKPTRYVGAGGNYVAVADGTADSVNLVGYDDSILDFYVPIFLVLQYIFYFGWLQVAKSLINPYGGDDDEDFDMEYLVNRNYQVGFLMIKDDNEKDESDALDLCKYDREDPPLILQIKSREFKRASSTTRDVFSKAGMEDLSNFKMVTMDEIKSKFSPHSPQKRSLVSQDTGESRKE